MQEIANETKELDAKGFFLSFDGDLPHWTAAFTGERYSATSFLHKAAERLTWDDASGLSDLGFTLKSVTPSRASTAPTNRSTVPRRTTSTLDELPAGLCAKALESKAKASSFETFRRLRPFVFLQHYAGSSGLGTCVVREAANRGLSATHVSRERLLGGSDLTATSSYQERTRLLNLLEGSR